MSGCPNTVEVAVATPEAKASRGRGPRRHLRLLGLGAAAIAGLLAWSSLAMAAPLASLSFTDHVGDTPALDVQSVTLTSDDQGFLDIGLRLNSLPTKRPPELIPPGAIGLSWDTVYIYIFDNALNSGPPLKLGCFNRSFPDSPVECGTFVISPQEGGFGLRGFIDPVISYDASTPNIGLRLDLAKLGIGIDDRGVTGGRRLPVKLPTSSLTGAEGNLDVMVWTVVGEGIPADYAPEPTFFNRFLSPQTGAPVTTPQLDRDNAQYHFNVATGRIIPPPKPKPRPLKVTSFQVGRSRTNQTYSFGFSLGWAGGIGRVHMQGRLEGTSNGRKVRYTWREDRAPAAGNVHGQVSVPPTWSGIVRGVFTVRDRVGVFVRRGAIRVPHRAIVVQPAGRRVPAAARRPGATRGGRVGGPAD
jgi:hypothetical protein